jgi:cytochrome c biogenesis factor
MINLLWGGSLIVIAGFLIALKRRISDNKSQKAKELKTDEQLTQV